MMNQIPAPTLGLPGTDPVDDHYAAMAALRRAKWWDTAGLRERWPMTTAEAVQLLDLGGQFAIDAEGLQDPIARQLVPGPSLGESGEHEWDACDILNAAGALEARQQWRATPSGHDPKKHACQIALEQARAAGEVQQITSGPGGQGPRFDAAHLLMLLLTCDHHEGRAKVIPLLKAVLEVDHGVTIP